MSKIINIYCDESCHLENDVHKVMVLGGIICPDDKRKQIYKEIREIKVKHGLKPNTEIKWTKIAPSKCDLYLDLVDYFFNNKYLGFRAIFLEKDKINHKKYSQTPDEFYYKIYYLMLKGVFESNYQYNIYVDIKDTQGHERTELLRNICNKLKIRKDYSQELVKKIQEVRSHEVELVQLSDLLIGAVSYINRGLSDSKAKLCIIDKIKTYSKYSLTTSTFLKETKFNLFHWEPDKEYHRWD